METKAESDRIRILLIDDEPGTLGGKVKAGGSKWFPVLDDPEDMPEPLGIPRYFELRWLAAPTDVREYWDLTGAVRHRSTKPLASETYVPEIVCFDYALTGTPVPVEERDHVPRDRVADITPLPKLRKLADSLGVRIPDGERLPDELNLSRKDCFGLYAGALLYSAFSEHPCGAVALTRYAEQTIGSSKDGQFFEWFLHTKHAGTFSRRGRPAPTWYELLRDGVRSLRARIEELFRAGLVGISLKDLAELQNDGSHGVLTVESPLGVRRLPVPGLFIDVPPAERNAEAAKWAEQLLVSRFRQCGDQVNTVPANMDDIRRGMVAAEELWNAYLDYDNERQLTEKRLRLSELLEGGAQPQDNEECDQLCSLFHADLKTNTCPRDDDWVRDARRYDERAQRWAVLFMVVRFLHHSISGNSKWRNKCLAEDREKAAAIFDIPVDPREVYLALFPRAYQPLIMPWTDPTSQSWGAHLNRKAIRPQDVLSGKATRLERMLMQDYATGIGLFRSTWHDNRQARLVFGLPAGEEEK